MMVSGSDPLESFVNSIQVVKNAFLPLESNFRKVAKNFEHCFSVVSKNGNLNGTVSDRNVELLAGQLNLKKSGHHVVVNGGDRQKGKVPVKVFVGIFAEKRGGNDHNYYSVPRDGVEKLNGNTLKRGLNERYGSHNGGKEDGNRNMNCLHFEVALAFLINGFLQAFLITFKGEKRGFQKKSHEDSSCNDNSHVKVEVEQWATSEIKRKKMKVKEGKDLPFENLIGLVFDQLSHFPNSDVGVQDHEHKNTDYEASIPPVNQSQHFRMLTSILEGKRADLNGFLGNLKFARVGGLPSNIVGVPSVKDVVEEGINNSVNQKDNGGNAPQKLANGLLPDKKKLFSVQDFFRYTEAEGKRFFQELDRDGDGQVTLEDLEIAMRKRKLPKRYAHEFMQHTRSHLFSKSFGWKEFFSLMEQKEPTILRAYTSLCLSKFGTLQKSEILASLENAGLPANEDNAVAMLRFLKADTEESISYGHFRNFMLLLPSDRLQEDPRSIWFEAAAVVSVPSPVEIPAESILKSALAGGLSCAFSASLMHPVDTVKTQVQASTLTFPEILSKLPQLGFRGLYKGSIPAILGQFSSHGLPTGICEASKLLLINVAPTLPEMQVESAASFCSTFLGTAMRVPCEVLKQRLQAGLFDNVADAIVGTWQQDGLRGFFRGTGATLCREIPFYVAGMGLYAESKKAARQLLGRELEPWETIAIGALSGGLTAVLTTPLDVIKTRMMTASQGQPVTLSIISLSILRHEGPLGFFKGAVPRFFWVAPLGAMNFAGYEIARKAMDKI